MRNFLLILSITLALSEGIFEGIRPRNEIELSNTDIIQSLESVCNSKNTAPDCSSTNDGSSIFCIWNTTDCTSRSESCPADLGAKLTALAECGATSQNRCPSPNCINAEVHAIAWMHVRAGIPVCNGIGSFIERARTEPQIAQVCADQLYCFASLGLEAGVDCSSNYTNADVTAAITVHQQSAQTHSSASINAPIVSVISACFLLLWHHHR